MDVFFTYVLRQFKHFFIIIRSDFIASYMIPEATRIAFNSFVMCRDIPSTSTTWISRVMIVFRRFDEVAHRMTERARKSKKGKIKVDSKLGKLGS